jgi:hypothetical protein
MTAILDVVAGLRAILEPDPDAVEVDETGAEPLSRATDTLYVYPVRVAESSIESGPTARQDFEVVAVFAVAASESAQRRRDEEVSAELDSRLGRYLAAVRGHRATPLWDFIQAAQRPAPTSLTSRAVALGITGYRIVS